MASSYALPLLPTPPTSSHAADSKSYHLSSGQQQQQRRNGHRYNHSHSGFVLGPPSAQSMASPSRSSLLPSLNGLYNHKNASSGSLYTHTEASKENSPFTSPEPPVFDPRKSLDPSHQHHRSEGAQASSGTSHEAERDIFAEQAKLRLAQEQSMSTGGSRSATGREHEHHLDTTEVRDTGVSSSHTSHHHHDHSQHNSGHHSHDHGTNSTSTVHDHEHHDSHSKSHSKSHSHSHSYSFSLPQSNIMKARARGDSDLGRPATASHHQDSLSRVSLASKGDLHIGQALLSVLVPLPYLLFSLGASASQHGTPAQAASKDPFASLTPVQQLQHAVLEHESAPHVSAGLSQSAHVTDMLIQACALASGVLILSDLLLRYRYRAKDSRPFSTQRDGKLESVHTAAGVELRSQAPVFMRTMLHTICSVTLPVYAALQLGGVRVGLVMLIASLCKYGQPLLSSQDTFSADVLGRRLHQHRASLAVLLLGLLADCLGWSLTKAPAVPLVCGYIALVAGVLLFPTAPSVSKRIEILNSNSSNSLINLSAGSLLAGVHLLGSLLSQSNPLVFPTASLAILNILGICTAAIGILLGLPGNDPATTSSDSGDHTHEKNRVSDAKIDGTKLDPLTTGSCIFVLSAFATLTPSPWSGSGFWSLLVELILISAGCMSLSQNVPFLSKASAHQHNHSHVHDHSHPHPHDHHHHDHGKHAHIKTDEKMSPVTRFLLSRCEPGSLLHSILLEKDSRRIAYFTLLNFAFMLLQGVYGYLSNSLGLLSDTVHMFFDCLGLIIGLFAAIASKWPATPEKPYGWGKLNTLAGFGNGIFLMLVSVEFVWEAVEGMLEGRELRHVQELLIVSTAGFAVNLVGLVAFGHAHHGHDHGGHDHSHGGHDHSHGGGHDHGHDHHHNENMHGIFLHIAADAGGSLAVILSTALTLWRPWYLWDPLATVFIAVLIFAAAVPLVLGSARKLLLVVDGPLEWTVREAVRGLGEDVVGVAGVQAMRIWGAEAEVVDDGHVHGHAHEHAGCGHGLNHHGHAHTHSHGHEHSGTHFTHSHAHHTHDDQGHDHAADHHNQHSHAHSHSHDDKHAHSHDHASHDHSSPSAKIILQGAIHIVATPQSNLEDVRRRVTEYLLDRGLALIVQVERDGEGEDSCWCGNGAGVSVDAGGRRGSGFGIGGSFGEAAGRRGSTYEVGAFGSPARGRGSALRLV